jgi:hypothetical protein
MMLTPYVDASSDNVASTGQVAINALRPGAFARGGRISDRPT